MAWQTKRLLESYILKKARRNTTVVKTKLSVERIRPWLYQFKSFMSAFTIFQISSQVWYGNYIYDPISSKSRCTVMNIWKQCKGRGQIKREEATLVKTKWRIWRIQVWKRTAQLAWQQKNDRRSNSTICPCGSIGLLFPRDLHHARPFHHWTLSVAGPQMTILFASWYLKPTLHLPGIIFCVPWPGWRNRSLRPSKVTLGTWYVSQAPREDYTRY